MPNDTLMTGLRQVWRDRTTDTLRVSLHLDEWQRAAFAEARPELVPDGAPTVVTFDVPLAARVRVSHLGVWEPRSI